jgi:hypothetical protein
MHAPSGDAPDARLRPSVVEAVSRWKHIWEIRDRPMCEAWGWVPYGRHGSRGMSTGSQRQPCNWPAEFKDEGKFVCSKHVRKKRTTLKVGLGFREGRCEATEVFIDRRDEA